MGVFHLDQPKQGQRDFEEIELVEKGVLVVCGALEGEVAFLLGQHY